MADFVAAEAAPGEVDLTWNSAARGTITGWNLYRGRQSDVVTEKVNAQLIPMGAGGRFSYHDSPGLSGSVYYRLAAVLPDGSESDQGWASLSVNGVVPGTFAFSLAGANPFRSQTALSYSLPKAGPVRITVYNVAGQRVTTLVNRQSTPGTFTVPLQLSRAGVYLVSLKAGEFSKNLRVIALP